MISLRSRLVGDVETGMSGAECRVTGRTVDGIVVDREERLAGDVKSGSNVTGAAVGCMSADVDSGMAVVELLFALLLFVGGRCVIFCSKTLTFSGCHS